MKEFFALAAILFVIILVGFVGITYANSEWNCITWHNATSEQTKVIAAECYVQEGNKWVSFETHVKNHHVDLTPQ